MSRPARGAKVKSIPKKTKPKTEKKKPTRSKGLGDSVEKALQITGVDQAVKMFTNGKDCGCEKRKEALNAMFPYKKISCLTEDLYKKWKRHRPKIGSVIRNEEQIVIMEVYNHLFNTRKDKPCTTCPNSGTTWMHLVKDIDRAFEVYKDKNK